MIQDLVQDFLLYYKECILIIGSTVILFSVLRRWLSGGKCQSTETLDGKTVIITGANTGIGKETARELAKRGAKVIMACRDIERAIKAACEIGNEHLPGPVSVRHLDLASFKSVRAFAKEILISESNINILINNAGLCCAKEITEDGNDVQFQTNHLGHFLLTNLLLDRIKESAPSRIINVSSLAHKSGKIDWNDLNQLNTTKSSYNSFKAYSQSKLANILFTKELAKRLKGTGVTTYAVHPGMVSTDFLRYMPDMTNSIIRALVSSFVHTFSKTAVEGAQTTVYCAVATELENKTGHYYSDCSETKPSGRALNEDDAKRFWDVSAEMVELEK